MRIDRHDHELRRAQQKDEQPPLHAPSIALVDQNRSITPELYIRIHSVCERLDGIDPYLVECVKAIVVS